MTKLIGASGNKVDPGYPKIFADSLKGQDIGAVLLAFNSAPAKPAEDEDDEEVKEKGGKKGDSKKKEPKKEAKKEVVQEVAKEPEKPAEPETGGISNIFGDD